MQILDTVWTEVQERGWALVQRISQRREVQEEMRKALLSSQKHQMVGLSASD